MDKHGSLIAPDTIRFERLLPGPIERVWAYLIESEKRAKWLASGPIEPHVGGAVRLTWLHSDLDAVQEPIPVEFKRYEKGHTMEARVTRCEPPRLLGFTWGADPERLSEVVIELSERGNEVLLVLTHKRLPSRNDLLGVSGGWHTHLDVLAEHLNGRTAPGFWSTHVAMRNTYEERMNAEQGA
ncbi:MAG: SRPBCC family protein [Flavobacteriales bacterium]|nr:SRPBCC family protein [Flavobacteriales bacterium]